MVPLLNDMKKSLSLPKISPMKKTALIIFLFTMTIFGFAQEDWFGFNRFKADNERIIKNGEFPEVVFMGNSITENWAYYHPDFSAKTITVAGVLADRPRLRCCCASRPMSSTSIPKRWSSWQAPTTWHTTAIGWSPTG